MKKAIFMILFFFATINLLNAQWAITYGGSNDDYAKSIQVTKDGGYIVAGITESFDVEKESVWVLKLHSRGDIEWEYSYSVDLPYESRGYTRVSSIQQTKDSGYIIAGYSGIPGGSYAWILKLSPNGMIEWFSHYSHPYKEIGDYTNCSVSSSQQTKDGGYIVVGDQSRTYLDPFKPPSLPCSIFVLKLSSQGNVHWSYRYGGSESDFGYSIQQTKDGGYIVAGSTQTFGAGYEDAWVLKLDSKGEIEWQRTYGGSDVDYASSIQQTTDGGYIVAGSTYSFGAGNKDIWILKFGSKGDVEWQRTYGGKRPDSARAIQQTMDGGYIITGWTKSFGAGEDDFLIFKLDSYGNIEWQRTCGGENSDGSSSIQQTKDKGYIVAGDTGSFGIGGFDFLILKLNPLGNIHTSCKLLGVSNLTVADTDISPQDTDVKPDDLWSPKKEWFYSFFIQATNADKEVLCKAPPEYTLTISATTGGTTDPIPGIYTYDEGTEVTITAIPDAHYIFTGWSGDVSGTDNPITITMNSDKSITANFIRVIYPPSNFTCQKVLNRSLSQAEYINVFSWKTNPNNIDIVKYRIYLIEGESKSLLVELNANTFQYWHRRVEKDKQYTYAICAVNVEDREGDPAFITVQ